MNSPDHRMRMIQVAFLYAQGIPQNKIATYFEWGTPALVTVLLNEARSQGFVEDSPVFRPDACEPGELASLETLSLNRLLRCALRLAATTAGVPPARALRNIQVLSSGGKGTGRDMIKRRIDFFARAVAPLLWARILKSGKCGVTWGFTLGTVVTEIARTAATEPVAGQRTFVAICGEPYSMEAYSSSSSRIAERLAILQGDPRRATTLRGLPAFIPPGFDHDEITRFVHEHTAYGRIFGSCAGARPTALISQLDTILSSAGTFESPISTFVTELMNKSGLSAERLGEVAYGDIGGVLIEREDLSPADEAEFRRVEKMWIGVGREDLAGVVARSAGTKNPGVVLLAIGANKAGIVHAAVRRGLVSELFVDHDLALALEERLRPEVAQCAKQFSADPDEVKSRISRRRKSGN